MTEGKIKDEARPGPAAAFLTWLRQGNMPRWIALGLFIGLISGLGAAGFFYLLELATHYSFNVLSGFPMLPPSGERIFAASEETPVFNRWIFFALPVIGGLLSGLIVYKLAPEAEGHGTDAMIKAFHHDHGLIRARVPLVKSVATIITLASGGSAGREGPIAQIGAGVGSWLAQRLGLSTRDRRILLLAGTGGGLGAIFRAPLGGAITALEVIYREDLETDAMIPTVISSITAYTVFAQVFGFNRIFHAATPVFRDPREIPFYVGLGLICVPIGVLYIRLFYGLRDRVFRPLALPDWLKPALGGLGVGLLGLVLPQVYGGGWGQIELAMLGKLSIGLMALLVAGKILATSLTIGSGGSGGVFGPTLFIGGMIGGVVGGLSHLFFPEIVSASDQHAFVLVGMASFFAGVANAPLGALMMVAEMTGGYGLVAPLLLVSMIALIFTRKWSIYKSQVKNKFASPAHMGEFTVNVLEELKVGEVFEPRPDIPRIPARLCFRDIQALVSGDENSAWPVVGEDGSMVGILSMDVTRPILFEREMECLVNAEDLAIPARSVNPQSSLYEALQEFLRHPISALFVVDGNNRILGLLHHRDLIRAYNNEMVRRLEKPEED